MSNKPLGYYTWIAELRDGTRIAELPDDGSQMVSVDTLKGLDVAIFWMLPLTASHHPIFLELAPGQEIRKYWSRTFQTFLDIAEPDKELPVVDKFGIADAAGHVAIWHYAFQDGSMLITEKPDF